jgi:hypothetical protein|tara:strand:- start:302 stop:505 length:204 start_codon:yes stop_codon:yes gene_type:complete
MYYIQAEKNAGGMFSIVCKRLRDFRGKEGTRYYVRKRKDIDTMDTIPIYEVVNGKLKPTGGFSFLWL